MQIFFAVRNLIELSKFNKSLKSLPKNPTLDYTLFETN